MSRRLAEDWVLPPRTAAPIDELTGFLGTLSGPASMNPNNPLNPKGNPSANAANPLLNPNLPGAWNNPSNPQLNPSLPGALSNPSNPAYNPNLPGAQNNPSNPRYNPMLPGSVNNPSSPALNPNYPGSMTNPASPMHNRYYPNPEAIGQRPPDLGPNASFPPGWRMEGVWKHADNYTQDTREWPDPTEPRPALAPEPRGCTCDTDDGQAKLDCPVHGMHAPENELAERSWSIPEQSPVGYPQDQPRTWQQAQSKVAQPTYPMGHQVMYHVSPRRHRESILNEGLQGGQQGRRQESPWKYTWPQPPGNYLFDNPEDAKEYVHIMSQYAPGTDWEDQYELEPTPEGFEQWPEEQQEEWHDNAEYHQVQEDPHGWDIYRVNAHGLPMGPDPEAQLGQYAKPWDLGQLHDAYQEAREGWLSDGHMPPDQGALHADVGSEYGQEPPRYYVPQDIHPNRIQLHQHLPRWGLDPEGYYDKEPNEYPQPWAMTPFTERPFPGHESRWTPKLAQEVFGCPHCGQRFFSNGWTGWTPIMHDGYGLRSWQCPKCGADLRVAENRPLRTAASQVMYHHARPEHRSDIEAQGLQPLSPPEVWETNRERGRYGKIAVPGPGPIPPQRIRRVAAWKDPEQLGSVGQCGEYAQALINQYPHLDLGSIRHPSGEFPEGIPAHWFAHDDTHAYDVFGKHRLAEMPSRWDGQLSLREHPNAINDWWDLESDHQNRAQDHVEQNQERWARIARVGAQHSMPCPNCGEPMFSSPQQTRMKCRACGYLTPQIGWDDPESWAETNEARPWADMVALPDRSPELINPGGWNFGPMRQGRVAKTGASEGRWVGPHPDHPDRRIRNNSWWHVTTNPDWQYDPTYQPQRAIGLGGQLDPGNLHVSSHEFLRYWLPYIAPDEKTPAYAAEVDMSELGPEDYYHNEPGGYPETVITNPAKVNIKQVVPLDQAVAQADQQYRWEPKTSQHLVPGIGPIHSMDHVKAIWDDQDPLDASASALDLDTVTPEMIQQARGYIQERSINELAPRAQNGMLHLYRAGPLSPGPNSFSLEPSQHHEQVHGWGGWYRTPLQNVLGYSGALQGANPYPGESEVLVHHDAVEPIRVGRKTAGIQFHPGPYAMKKQLWGRGLLTPDGTFHSWPEEHAQHDERARELGYDPRECVMYHIDPQGRTTLGGYNIRLDQQAPLLQKAIEADPRLQSYDKTAGMRVGKTATVPWESYMYHVAPSAAREQILSQGLDPSNPQRMDSKHEPGVYLWEDPQTAWKYRGQGQNMYSDMDVHKVNVDGLKLQPDRWLRQNRPDRDEDFPGAWYAQEPIGPERISEYFYDPWKRAHKTGAVRSWQKGQYGNGLIHGDDLHLWPMGDGQPTHEQMADLLGIEPDAHVVINPAGGYLLKGGRAGHPGTMEWIQHQHPDLWPMPQIRIHEDMGDDDIVNPGGTFSKAATPAQRSLMPLTSSANPPTRHGRIDKRSDQEQQEWHYKQSSADRQAHQPRARKRTYAHEEAQPDRQRNYYHWPRLAQDVKHSRAWVPQHPQQDDGDHIGYDYQSLWPRIHKSKLAKPTMATWDPLTCEHCGSPMTEPKMIGNKWINHCINCGLAREVPSKYPLLQQQRQDQGYTEYPSLLNEVGQGQNRPWTYVAKTAAWPLEGIKRRAVKHLTDAFGEYSIHSHRAAEAIDAILQERQEPDTHPNRAQDVPGLSEAELSAPKSKRRGSASMSHQRSMPEPVWQWGRAS